MLGELPSTKKDANTFKEIVFGLYFGIALSLFGIYLCVSYIKIMPNRGRFKHSTERYLIDNKICVPFIIYECFYYTSLLLENVSLTIIDIMISNFKLRQPSSSTLLLIDNSFRNTKSR